MSTTTPKGLFIWVEGRDDERMVDAVITPVLSQIYSYVKILQYAQKTPKYVNKFIRSLDAMGADYAFLGDNDSGCPIRQRDKVVDKYRRVDKGHVSIVVTEIEGWYLAGIDDVNLCELGCERSAPSATDAVTKEQFNELIPPRFNSRIDFMNEVLKRYVLEVAPTRNRSLSRFLSSFGLEDVAQPRR